MKQDPDAQLAAVWKFVGVVSKTDEFCIKCEELCIKNEELCIKNDELCRSRQRKSGRSQCGTRQTRSTSRPTARICWTKTATVRGTGRSIRYCGSSSGRRWSGSGTTSMSGRASRRRRSSTAEWRACARALADTNAPAQPSPTRPAVSPAGRQGPACRFRPKTMICQITSSPPLYVVL